MSVRLDRDEDERRLNRAVAELKRPVRFDRTIDARAIETIRAGRLVPARGPRGLPRRWVAAAGSAALAASLLLAVLLRAPSSPAPGGAAPTSAAPTDGSRAVKLTLALPASSRVVVVGDFNNWDPAATPLQHSGGSGEWTVELRLVPGRYRYSFLVDGREWVRDPSEPRADDTEYGAPASVLTVT